MRNFLLICMCGLSIACTKSYDFNGVLKMERLFREKSTEMETAKDSLQFRAQAEELRRVAGVSADPGHADGRVGHEGRPAERP